MLCFQLESLDCLLKRQHIHPYMLHNRSFLFACRRIFIPICARWCADSSSQNKYMCLYTIFYILFIHVWLSYRENCINFQVSFLSTYLILLYILSLFFSLCRGQEHYFYELLMKFHCLEINKSILVIFLLKLILNFYKLCISIWKTNFYQIN